MSQSLAHWQVSQIILGCMSYGVKRPKDNWTWVLEEEEAMKHLKVGLVVCMSNCDVADTQHAYDAGINVSILYLIGSAKGTR